MTSFSLDFETAGSFEDVLASVKAHLKEQGFGTLSEIDVQATLKEKIDKDIPPYTILGVCNPNLAAQALDEEPKIGVFLPCTVVVREDGLRIRIYAQNPELMASIVGNPVLGPLALEATDRISDALSKAMN